MINDELEDVSEKTVKNAWGLVTPSLKSAGFPVPDLKRMGPAGLMEFLIRPDDCRGDPRRFAVVPFGTVADHLLKSGIDPDFIKIFLHQAQDSMRDMEITGANDHVRVVALTASGDAWNKFNDELPKLLDMIAGLETQKD